MRDFKNVWATDVPESSENIQQAINEHFFEIDFQCANWDGKVSVEKRENLEKEINSILNAESGKVKVLANAIHSNFEGHSPAVCFAAIQLLSKGLSEHIGIKEQIFLVQWVNSAFDIELAYELLKKGAQ